MVTIETTSPRIVAAPNLLDRFKTIVAAKKPDDLAPWLRDAVDSELTSFDSRIQAGEAGVGGGHRRALVQRPDRGRSHPAQARQASVVRPRQHRPPVHSNGAMQETG